MPHKPTQIKSCHNSSCVSASTAETMNAIVSLMKFEGDQLSVQSAGWKLSGQSTCNCKMKLTSIIMWFINDIENFAFVMKILLLLFSSVHVGWVWWGI